MMNRRFRKGSGKFKCRCCGLESRDVNGANGSLELCMVCLAEAEYENSCSDYGEDSEEAKSAYESYKYEALNNKKERKCGCGKEFY